MALVSSSQIFMPSSAALPAEASPPVSPMPKPILIGSAAPAVPAANAMKTAAAASRRRTREVAIVSSPDFARL